MKYKSSLKHVLLILMLVFSSSRPALAKEGERIAEAEKIVGYQQWKSFTHHRHQQCRTEYGKGYVIAKACGISRSAKVYFQLGQQLSPVTTLTLAEDGSHEGIVIHSILVDSFTTLIQIVDTNSVSK